MCTKFLVMVYFDTLNLQPASTFITEYGADSVSFLPKRQVMFRVAYLTLHGKKSVNIVNKHIGRILASVHVQKHVSSMLLENIRQTGRVTCTANLEWGAYALNIINSLS